jgi:glycosidase
LRSKVGYEIFVDRFFPYFEKKNIKSWDLEVRKHERQEYDFYGGDLLGIAEKVEYLKNLGIDFLYLTPIFEAKTNHRYDCTNYFEIDPLVGTEKDLEMLCKKMAQNNIRIFLDIALNHMSKQSNWFQKAIKGGKEKRFFRIREDSVTRWGNVEQLVELNLENEDLQDILWKQDNSAMKYWSKFGISGWRLDCAYELGYEILKRIRASFKDDNISFIGEIWSYPGKWVEEGILDGVMNYFYKELIDDFLELKINGNVFSEILETLYFDVGNKLLKSWNILSSHDTSRIRTKYGERWKIAVGLQFTLPGSPLIYYGEELGLEGEGDPLCRNPMKWERWSEDNYQTFNFYKNIINFFKSSKSLYEGKFKKNYSNNKNILSFLRLTNCIDELRLIIANPSVKEQDFILYTQESSLMNHTFLEDYFSKNKVEVKSSKIIGKVSPNSFSIFLPKINRDSKAYSPYKRVF